MQSIQSKATVQSRSSLGAAFKELKDQIKRATAQYEAISAIETIQMMLWWWWYDVDTKIVSEMWLWEKPLRRCRSRMWPDRRISHTVGTTVKCMVVVAVSNCYHAYALVAHSIFVAIDPGRRVKQSQTGANISGLLGSQSCRGTAVIPLVS